MKKTTIASNPENMLADIHSKLTAFAIVFRDKVGEECSWSAPTFYRKMKNPGNLSNAEKDKIVAVLDETFKDLWDHCEKYRKS
jgi:hypothetical protein